LLQKALPQEHCKDRKRGRGYFSMDKEDKVVPFVEDAAAAPDGARKGRRVTGRDSNRRDGGGDKREKEQSEWEEKIIQVRRVTKVVKGGKKLSFRAVVAVGNGKGQVGIGVGKASEVVSAIQKGVVDAKKSLINVPLVGATIPHQIIGKTGSSRILLRPAAKGTGVIAGGAARAILELAGVGDVLSKSLGARSPLNVARATVNGLKNLRTFEEAARLRGVSIRQLFA
jgi:small subunit ribosomal protein S5